MLALLIAILVVAVVVAIYFVGRARASSGPPTPPPSPPKCDPAMCVAPNGQCVDDVCVCAPNHAGPLCQATACGPTNCGKGGACVGGVCAGGPNGGCFDGWTSSGGPQLCDVCAGGRGPAGDCSQHWATHTFGKYDKQGLSCQDSPYFGCYLGASNSGTLSSVTQQECGGGGTLCTVTGWFSQPDVPDGSCGQWASINHDVGWMCH